MRKLFWYGLLAIFLAGLGALWLFGEQISTKSAAFGGCDETLWEKHVYNPARLQVHERCTSVTGTIVDATHGKSKRGCRSESDGDFHCWVKLDAGQANFLNQKNIDNQEGNLVFEPMCQHKVTQADAKAACKNWKQKLTLPPVGSHVRLTGSFVTDLQHGHMEIHPVGSIEVLANTAK